MAVPETSLPFGLRDVKLRRINPDGTRDAAVDLPNSRTFSFSEAEDFEELRGDDQLVAVRGTGPEVSWDLEAGGISLDAYLVIAGGAIVETTDASSNVTSRTYTKTGRDQRPYFEVEGQAISDSGGDFHAVVFRCRATDSLDGSLEDGSFWLTSCSGRGLPDPDNADALYEFTVNDTATDIAP